MISTRHLDTQSLPNLIINGAFDHLEPSKNNFIPHFWALENLELREPKARSENVYKIVQGETLNRAEDLRDYFCIELSTKPTASMTQSFLIDPNVAFDFPIPMAPSATRLEVSAGYLSPFNTFLVRSNTFTLGLSARVVRGAAKITAAFLNSVGAPILETVLTESASAFFTKQRWRRYTGQLTPEQTPSAIKISVIRSDPTEFLELHIGNIQLVCGAYHDVPYTGDRLLSAIPKNAIVLSLGTGCPPGFIELEEPDGVSVPESWTQQDTSLKARHNLFPIGISGNLDPSALVGDPTHNRSEYRFTLALDDVEAFESYDSLQVIQTTVPVPSTQPGSTITSVSETQSSYAADEATNGTADHQHNVSAAGSIPLNRSFRFCRKL